MVRAPPIRRCFDQMLRESIRSAGEEASMDLSRSLVAILSSTQGPYNPGKLYVE